MKRVFPSLVSLSLAVGLVCAVRADDLITPGATLVEVHSAQKFFEGPTWDPYTQRLYFSSLTVPSQLLSLKPPNIVANWMSNSQGINGTLLSRDGRLLCCQQDARRILSVGITAEGPFDTWLLGHDANWIAPNDLCQTPNGDIYFTAPDFNTRTNSLVYHLKPWGTATPVITDMTLCNGIMCSLDGSTLYVSDSHEKWWRSYPILPDGTVGAGSLFFNPATPNMNDPDGMTIDEFGNLYFTGRGGIWIVSPAGLQLDMIPVPVFPTNVTFGGADGRTLYITCDTKVYSLSMQVRGALWQGVAESNLPPVVDAGEDQTVSIRYPVVTLSGSVTDDGVPAWPEAMRTEWSLVSGPMHPYIARGDEPVTPAAFGVPGTYVLELVAFDGLLPARDQTTVKVLAVGDFNGDNLVDSADGVLFYGCMTGANITPPPLGCELVDIDRDLDVDMDDHALFQRCRTAGGATADPNCGRW